MTAPQNTSEEFVPVDESAEGRKLSRPLKDEYDRTLLPAGTVLDDAVISRLADIGVKGAWVAKRSGPEGSALTLEAVFRDRLDDPLMAAVYDAARAIMAAEGGP